MAKTKTGFLLVEFDREFIYGKTQGDIKFAAAVLSDKIYQCVIKNDFQEIKRLELQN